MRDHGGDLDRAKTLYGGTDWIDLSTGINPVPYPVGDIPNRAFATLPTRQELADLEATAARTYRTEAHVVALGGAQAAIQLVPRLKTPGTAKVVGPTYNEHAAALQEQGWVVDHVEALSDLKGADLAIVVNPNNPDGRTWEPGVLSDLSSAVGLLVVDESFADPHALLSMAPDLHHHGDDVLVLRSFGKFYGLAGLRLGFALGGAATIAKLRALAGPWAANGPAIAVARTALSDTEWQKSTAERLGSDCARLDALAEGAGWRVLGGSALFRTFETPNAPQAQTELAKLGIWTRIFPYSDTWLRMGLPGSKAAWERVESALACGGK